MIRSIYLLPRFYYVLTAVIILMVLSHVYPFVFYIGIALLFVLGLVVLFEMYWTKNVAKNITVDRAVQQKLSLGDDQKIKYAIGNNNQRNIAYQLYDELPFQLQFRTSISEGNLPSMENKNIEQHIRPIERGVYNFGDAHMFIHNALTAIIERRVTFKLANDVDVYPSILQMRKYELQVFSKTAIFQGVRRIRQLGENDEFESLKPYQQGDNIKSVNWTATARANKLIVNQFQNTRSQSVYCLIDKGRSMKMPFNELSLLDYAINSSLVISNIILRKYDKVGLVTFSDKIGDIIPSNNKPGQLELIAEKLYKQKTDFKDSNFKLLHTTLKRSIRRRNIFLMFTNFENMIELDRNLSFIRSLSKQHLLVVIIFINTEIEIASEISCELKSDIYFKTFAQTSMLEKEKIKLKLESLGIQTILTTPKDLNINVINKYLEIKAKRMR